MNDENQPLFETLGSIDYDKIDITNDFMFSYIMRQQDICIGMLESFFPGKKIRRIHYIPANGKDEPSDEEVVSESNTPDTQKVIAEIFGKRGVRLDVYLDDGKTVYNVEMQTTNEHDLPKRARFYQAQIDINLLNRGVDYEKLKPTFVIFICKFDPFKKGQYRYTFKNVCDKESNLELGDETYKLFFNTAGTKGDISDDLWELLRYMNSVKDFPIDKTDNELIHKIDRAVDIARQSDEWRRAHMNYLLQQRDAEKRGEAKGREEGRKEGRKEGRAEGAEGKAHDLALKMYRRGDSLADIADLVEYSVDVVRHWINGAGATPIVGN